MRCAENGMKGRGNFKFEYNSTRYETVCVFTFLYIIQFFRLLCVFYSSFIFFIFCFNYLKKNGIATTTHMNKQQQYEVSLKPTIINIVLSKKQKKKIIKEGGTLNNNTNKILKKNDKNLL